MVRPKATRTVLVLAVALLLPLLAGCFSKDAPSAHVRFEQARDRFIADLGPDGDIAAFDGALVAGAGTEGDLRIEYGADGTTRLTASAGPLFSITVYCVGDGGVQKIGEDVYASRHRPGLCDQIGETVPDGSFERSHVTDLEEHEDGMTVTVEVRNGSRVEGDQTWFLDGDDMVTRIEVEAQGQTFRLDVVYGPRSPIEVPEPTGRLPLQVRSTTRLDQDGNITWTWDALQVDHPAPLSEFTARLLEETEDGNQTVVVAFALDGGPQAGDGFTFTFTDGDGDGRLSQGDRVEIGTDNGSMDGTRFVVDIYDLWADRSLEDNPLPAPWSLPLAAVVPFILWRRRANR